MLLFLFYTSAAAYGQTARITGKILNAKNQPLVAASIGVQGFNLATQSNADGSFKVIVHANTNIRLIIRYVGYQEKSITLKLQAGELRQLNAIYLTPDTAALGTVIVRGKNLASTRAEASTTLLDPRTTKVIPTAFNDFNKILATLPGVVSNNELSSTYSVRGGNYDENLVYVNGIEIYRPFLISNAQQEGLSFINPDLVGNIEFSSGGWQPKFGDKLSSVLNIVYKTPEKFAASVSGGLLGGTAHVEGISKNKRMTYLVGARYKNAQLLFNKALEVSGNYQPKFGDLQAYLTYNLNKHNPEKTRVSFLGSLAKNKYLLIPTNRETTFGTYDNFLHLSVAYAGREQMEYDMYQGGLNLQHQFSDKVSTEIIFSSLLSREREYRNVEAGYLLCELDIDPNSPTFNQCLTQRDVGTDFEYTRNNLKAKIFSVENRYLWQKSNLDQFRGSIKYSRENITDQLAEYSFLDSADFVSFQNQVQTNLQLVSNRWQAYTQHTHLFAGGQTLTYGLRLNHWDYNKQTTFSPRVQFAFPAPRNERLSYKLAVGMYHQPPFYRELRNQKGNLNPKVEAQQALHVIAGQEYRFTTWNRDFKWTSEVYYKNLTHVIPYEVDNVRLRYFAQNNAKAYAVGFDTRINGEFIKGAESWFSLGIMSTKEDIAGDSAIIYNQDNTILEKNALGYIRRPTDQRVNFGVFFQDHLPNDPSFKLYLNLIFGSGLPFGFPGNESSRNRYTMPSYKRVDIGFSKLITLREGLNNHRGLESLWFSLEVLNLISANNVISYNYIQDVNRLTYSVPNYLSSRLVNLRFIARF